MAKVAYVAVPLDQYIEQRMTDSTMHFSDPFLEALGAWQNGWAEDQTRRISLAEDLAREAVSLPAMFRTVTTRCWRKRFLYPGELSPLFLEPGELRDGPTSWTTDRNFANSFKGIWRAGAITAAIFEHQPLPEEIILNVGALWKNADFVAAADRYRQSDMPFSAALSHFADRQGEVVLDAPMTVPDIVALSGFGSELEELLAGSDFESEADQNKISAELARRGIYPGISPVLLDDEGARRVVLGVVERMRGVLRRHRP
jgi:hypothetical protein